MTVRSDERLRKRFQRFSGRQLAIWIERGFGIAIVVALIGLLRDVIVDGYLPDPFLHAKADSFNDWYNSAYWAHNLGAYTEWSSIYPPFSFVFLRYLSNAKCYIYTADSSRGCDPAGIVLITLFSILNFILIVIVFRRIDKSTALPRALALGLGLPVIFAWERGNLIVPCFTAFILAYGNVIKSARLKAVFAAISINFKPYLILALVGRLIRRDWEWIEWCGIGFVLIYAASLAIMGAGDPFALVRNTAAFDHLPSIDLIGFTTTYVGLLTVVKLPLPIVELLGSAPVEVMERYVPVFMYGAAAAVLACLTYAACRPTTLSRSRISALMLILFMSLSVAPGGYSVEFALFFVFAEKWSGAGRVTALICSYLWCIPADIPIAVVYHETGFSFLSQRTIMYDLLVTLGQILRPGLLVLLEIGLVGASLQDIFRDLRILRQADDSGVAPTDVVAYGQGPSGSGLR